METHVHQVEQAAGPTHALVVEDDRDLLATICEALAACGVDATPASSAEHAMADLESGLRPDFVLLDLGLPRMSGNEMLLRLKRNDRWRDISVAAMTAYPQKLLDVFGLADALLPKPFALETLEEMVSVLSRSARPLDEATVSSSA